MDRKTKEFCKDISGNKGVKWNINVSKRWENEKNNSYNSERSFKGIRTNR